MCGSVSSCVTEPHCPTIGILDLWEKLIVQQVFIQNSHFSNILSLVSVSSDIVRNVGQL